MSNSIFHVFDNIKHYRAGLESIICILTNENSDDKMTIDCNNITFYCNTNNKHTIIGLKCGTKVSVNVSRDYIIKDIKECS